MKDTKYRFFFGVFVGFVLAGFFFFFFFKAAHAKTRPMSPQAHYVADGTYQQASYEDKASEAGYNYAQAKYDYLANHRYGNEYYIDYADDYNYESDHSDAIAAYYDGYNYDIARHYQESRYLGDKASYTYQASTYVG
jgi:hypothetical protein